MKLRFSLLIWVVLLPCIVFAATLSVKQDGTGDFSLIQSALSAANPGDTVLVYPGRYFENLTIQTNNITLMSLEGSTGDASFIDSTIIDGNNLDRCIRSMNENILIRGFSLTNGMVSGAGGGVSISKTTSVTNCKIFNNKARTGGGINVIGSEAHFSGVDVYQNYALIFGGGIFATGVTGYPCNLTFDPVNRCSIYNNRAGTGQDIYIQYAEQDLYLPLDTFSIADPGVYHAVYLATNPFTTNYQIIFDILNAHHQEIDGNLYVSPQGDDANDGSSPATPLKTIHEAIYRIAPDSLNQNTVILQPGSYSRTDNDQIFPIALKGWVIVQGSGIDITTVICEPHPDITLNYGSWDKVFSATKLESATIADMTFLSRDTDNCGVISANNKSIVNLKNIRIDAFRPDYAAIIYLISNNERETTWENVTIENITTPNAGLISIDLPITGSIKNSVFRNATSTYVSSSVWAHTLIKIVADKSLEVENCQFINLTMLDDDSHAVSFTGAQFPQQQNRFSFRNCLFSGNESQGGIAVIGSSNNPNIELSNCTLAGNQSDTFTLSVNGNVNISNCIFDNDSPFQIRVNPMYGDPNEHTNLTVDYSLIKDGLPGIQPFPIPGNTIDFLPSSLSGDPFFLGGDDIHNPLYYSLSAASPCINSGTPDISGLGLPPYDLAGNWRVWDGRIDMGCYEFGSKPWVSNDDPTTPAIGTPVLEQNYPNPFNPITTIKYTIEKPGEVSLDIYNVKGQLVKTLYHGTATVGSHTAIWNGFDNSGNACPSGVYFYNLRTPNANLVRKMLLLK
ncbi:MAG: T9SS type A sorting domain-containing protein [Candidatus Cloacimonetes bacterium]|nr:T9SS type A sorting domain-containing protein [Candidatus Cloacimonadota bacterium]